MSNVERSKCSGGCPEMRSPARVPKWRSAHSTNATTLACSIITPFGAPVEPEVNKRWARSGLAAAGVWAGNDARSSRANTDANR